MTVVLVKVEVVVLTDLSTFVVTTVLVGADWVIVCVYVSVRVAVN